MTRTRTIQGELLTVAAHELSLTPCGCCDGWVAAIGSVELEDPCPLVACLRAICARIAEVRAELERKSA